MLVVFLIAWMGSMEIRSQNELTAFGFAKDYDAIVTVRTDIGERRFALEYERTPKAAKCRGRPLPAHNWNLATGIYRIP